MPGEQATRGRGRPRSERARLAILAAAGELMLAGGISAASMEAIAERAGVSKATIYKWWPSRGAVALDGFLAAVRDSMTVPEGLNTADALRFQVAAVVTLFRDTASGPLMRALVGQAERDPEIARAIRERWLAPRRAVSVEILRAGMASGEIRPDIDIEVALDQLYAPVYHRLFFAHEPLDDGLADRLVTQTLAGLAP
jgi:AcrR family transcriptional regulator